MSEMNINEILACLPHRPPFLLIDKVLTMTEGQSLTAIKNVSMNEPFFVGHFPEEPVMPGVLMLEALAQAAGVLAYKTLQKNGENYLFYFAGIDGARFKRMVLPGDQLTLQVDFVKMKKDLFKVKGVASVDGDLACSAELLCVGREVKRD